MDDFSFTTSADWTIDLNAVSPNGLYVVFQDLDGGTSSTDTWFGPATGIFGLQVPGNYTLNLYPRGNAGVTDYEVATNVSAVPLPAAAWLFGSALIGTGIVGRRKKKV